jgi:hypothetical protein
MGRLPDFLIIGAMKAGTTSLYRDLLTNPAVFFPADKEPGNLTDDRVLAEAGRREYELLFRGAVEGQICGEASTTYTKEPDLSGAATRAREVLGPDAKIVYLVREPVERIISQHYHEYREGFVGEDIDEAVRRHRRYVATSSYAMQVAPWIEALGADRVRILLFETYVGERVATVEALSRFLGAPARGDLIDPDARHNRGEEAGIASGFRQTFAMSAFYRRLVRPLLPLDTRNSLRNLVAPKPPPHPAPPSYATIEHLLEQLRDDTARLASLMGRSEPPWRPEDVLKHARKAPTSPFARKQT